MNRRNQILVIFITLALVTMACDIPFMTAKPAPFGTLTPVSSQPTRTMVVLPTIIQTGGTPAPDVTAAPISGQPTVAAVIPSAADLTAVTLKIDDFPPGFTALDTATEQEIGITQAKVAGMFQGMFAQARTVNYFAFLNPTSDSYQLVFGTLFSPLTVKEGAAFDQELDDPTRAKQSFTSGLGGNAEVLSGTGGLGEKSIGFTFTTPANSITLRSDLMMVRRGSVVILMITMYQDGVMPNIDAISLATILDGRLKEVSPH